MKNTLFFFKIALIALIIINFSACKKYEDKDLNQYKKFEQVIIGCKSGNGFTAAIDPLSPNIHTFSSNLFENLIGGPSCLNQDKTFYYAVGSDKMIDEIDVNSGFVNKSIQIDGLPIFIEFSNSTNEILYALPVGNSTNFQLKKVNLSNGNINSLFTFDSENGYLGRSSFLRNGDIYFINGIGELMHIDLSSESCHKIIKLNGNSNMVEYDNKLDKVFYFQSKNMSDFALHAYDFNSNTDVLLKNFTEIKSYLYSTNAYSTLNNNLYFYTTQNKRACINVISLELSIEPVDYALSNTEIIDCKIKKENQKN